MKILIVAVFCTYFVAVAFSNEYNSTMPSQLAEKSLPPTRPPFHPPIIHSPAISRKLSTVLIADRRYRTHNFGVLLSRERVAFPESHWKENESMSAFVYCWNQNLKELYWKNYKLQYRIPEWERLYLAEGTVEVKLSPEVDYECWPYTEKRYTKRAKKLAIGETVIAIGKLPAEDGPIIPKTYVIKGGNEKIVEIAGKPNGPAAIKFFSEGEPLYRNDEIVGIFVPTITIREAKDDKTMIYVRLRENPLNNSLIK